MIYLELFTKIDKQLHKARSIIVFLTILFGGLPLMIFIDDFYSFISVSSFHLWNRPYS